MNEALQAERYAFVTERKRRQLLKENGLRLDVGRRGAYRPDTKTSTQIVCDVVADFIRSIPQRLRSFVRVLKSIDTLLFGPDRAFAWTTYICWAMVVGIVILLFSAQIHRLGSSP